MVGLPIHGLTRRDHDVAHAARAGVGAFIASGWYVFARWGKGIGAGDGRVAVNRGFQWGKPIGGRLGRVLYDASQGCAGEVGREATTTAGRPRMRREGGSGWGCWALAGRFRFAHICVALFAMD